MLPPRGNAFDPSGMRGWQTFMVRNLYLILVVVFRATGLVSTGSAVLAFVVGLIVARGSIMPLFAFMPAFLGGLLFWVLAKPLAALTTSGLE